MQVEGRKGDSTLPAPTSEASSVLPSPLLPGGSHGSPLQCLCLHLLHLGGIWDGRKHSGVQWCGGLRWGGGQSEGTLISSVRASLLPTPPAASLLVCMQSWEVATPPVPSLRPASRCSWGCAGRGGMGAVQEGGQWGQGAVLHHLSPPTAAEDVQMRHFRACMGMSMITYSLQLTPAC